MRLVLYDDLENVAARLPPEGLDGGLVQRDNGTLYRTLDRTVDRTLDESSDRARDGTSDRAFDKKFDGTFHGAFVGTTDGTLVHDVGLYDAATIMTVVKVL